MATERDYLSLADRSAFHLELVTRPPTSDYLCCESQPETMALTQDRRALYEEAVITFGNALDPTRPRISDDPEKRRRIRAPSSASTTAKQLTLRIRSARWRIGWRSTPRYNQAVKPLLDDALEGLREATELARSIRTALDEDYLLWIAELEARPENQPGADKTAVWHAQRVYLDFFERVRSVSARV